jgi:hypothetical protein
MGKVWVKELTGGLDVRRSPETTPGGLLIKGQDGHINSGGEFEKRAAFTAAYTLPSGTVGLAADTAGLIVFGSGTNPGVPTGVTYQRLQKDAKTLVDVPSWDQYSEDIYAVGEFNDGTIVHYLDAVEVTDWFDGRARASFDVTNGNAAIAATGEFTVTGGTLGGGNEITSVEIDGIDILTGPIAHTGNNTTTAANLVTAINALTSSPNYSATQDGATVNISAALTGVAANGKTIVVVVGGDATVGNIVHMQGGSATSQITDIKVNGVSIINAPVPWDTDVEETADDISDAINAHTSTPDYDATSSGARVNIIADAAGTGSNGFAVVITVASGMTLSTYSTTMTGGVASAAFVPGEFVKTLGRRVMATSGSVWHISGADAPTGWTTDNTGAGFFDQAREASAAREVQALANYQGFVAVFAKGAILIWFFDPDPDLISKRQVLANTGTVSPRSVTEFGDADVFYLALSGLRSLRARDSSNNATTSDLGSPVDKLIRAKLTAMSTEERRGVFGLMNPVDDRFWLIFPDGQIFVFSYFPAAKVSAWTTYQTGFAVDAAVRFGDKVYLRSGNTIYEYDGVTYDATSAKCWLPYFDAGNPTLEKQWQGWDAAVEGEWAVYAAMQPTALDAREQIATINETTYNKQRIPFEHSCTHVSPQLESQGAGAAKVSSIVMHYVGDPTKDD